MIRRLLCAVLALLGVASLGSGPAGPGAADTAQPSVEGRWAQKIVMTSLSDPPVVGRVTSQTITHMIVDIDRDGRELDLTTETCDIDIESSVDIVRTIVPDTFVRAIPTGHRSGQLIEVGGETRIRVHRNQTVFGADLRQPTHEVLPDGRDDRRVVDFDDDGHPGVTVRVEGLIGGELYIVQRAWDAYAGRLGDDGRITGTVDWGVEQSILDATSVFLKSQPATEPHPDDEKSRFTMIPVPDDASCRWLNRRPELFDD